MRHSQFLFVAFLQISSAAVVPGELLSDTELLEERDVCTSRTDTELIGDGAPLQIKKYIQVTVSLDKVGRWRCLS